VVVDVHCTSDYSGIELPPTADSQHSKSRPQLTTLLLIAVWFGVVTGLIEGAGLMLFQRLNWASWGPMLHVSWPILWIAPLVDVTLFLAPASVTALVLGIWPRSTALTILVFMLSLASVYDWLTVTGRLLHWSSLLLAFGVSVALTRWIAKHEDLAIHFWKKSTGWLVATVLLVLLAIEGGRSLAEQRLLASLPVPVPASPNVLLIVIDTLRADHLSSYGYSRATSPTIDRMGREGVVFENAIATCSWSFPSHVSLLTGRYQFEHRMGAVPRMPVLGPAVASFHGYPTLGEALEQLGYRTAGFSANRTFFSSELGFWQGMTHFEDYFHSPADAFVRTLYGREFSRIYLSRTEHSKPKRLLRWLGIDSILDGDEEGSGSFGGAQGVRKRAPEVNRELLSWVGQSTESRRPFFAVLNYFDVHAPYGGPRSFLRPWTQNDPVDLYDDSIRYVDQSVDELMAELARRGFADNTLVIVTSDHGESLGEHGLESHGAALYRELIRVPLVLWFPTRIPSGQRVAEEVSSGAIPATVMDLLPGNPQPFPRPSLSVFWSRDPTKKADPVALSELTENHFLAKIEQAAARAVPSAISGSMKSLVQGPWHLIVHSTLGVQLYNWDNDPTEANNLVNTPAGHEVSRQLNDKIQNLIGEPREPLVPSPAHNLAPSAR
jgi:arylsulfatase A-like enzyme